jgi:hypothetical protein
MKKIISTFILTSILIASPVAIFAADVTTGGTISSSTTQKVSQQERELLKKLKQIKKQSKSTKQKIKKNISQNKKVVNKVKKERTAVKKHRSKSKIPTTKTITSPVVGLGARCGGNMTTAATCATGFYCAPSTGSHLPFGDVGGTCAVN